MLLALRERDGKFLVDLRETWIRNEAEYFELNGKLEVFPTPTGKEDETYESARWIILGKGVMAKYCKMNKELNETMQQAKRFLTNEEIEKIKAVLNEVFPGELSPRQEEIH